MKGLVYESQVYSVEDLEIRIIVAAGIIQITPVDFSAFSKSFTVLIVQRHTWPPL